MADAKLQAVITVANKASAPLKAINSDLNKLRSPIRNLSRQVKAFDRASGFKEMRKGVAGLAGQLTRLGIAGVGTAAGIFAAVNKIADTGDEIIKTATAVGISTDSLQEWRFVAERTGVSQAAMNKSMQAFTKRLAEARNGTGELHGLLNKQNPEFLKQLLAVENNTDAFDLMVKSMSKLPDQQRQILLGDKAFSESGRELVKITAMSAKEIENLKKELGEMGGVLSKESLVKSAKFKDEMTNMSFVIRSLAFSVGAELLPAIKDIMKDMTEWFKSFKKDDIKQFGKDAAESIKGFAKWVKDVSPTVLGFIENIGGIKTIAIGLGLVLAGPLLSAVVTLGAAMLATPLGLFVTGVAGLIVLGSKLYDSWEPFWNLIESIKTGFQNFLSIAGKVGEAIGGFAFDLFGDDGGASATTRFRRAPAVNPNGNSRVKQFNSSALAGSQKGSNSDVSGVIKVQIESSGVAKVKQVKSENSRVGFDVDAGMSFGHDF